MEMKDISWEIPGAKLAFGRYTCIHEKVKYIQVAVGFPDSSVGKESACNAGDPGLIPGLGRSPGEEKGYPLQYSDLDNSTDYIVHGVAEDRTQLSDFHFTFTFIFISL